MFVAYILILVGQPSQPLNVAIAKASRKTKTPWVTSHHDTARFLRIILPDILPHFRMS